MVGRQPNPDIAWREIEGETVLIDPRSGRVVVLNAIGSEVWRGLGRGATLGEIARDVATRHRISQAVAAQDVNLFVSELETRDLVVGSTSEEAP